MESAHAGKIKQVSSDSDSFSKILSGSLEKVNKLQIDSEKMDRLFAAGMVDNIADVTIAATKADLAVSYAVEVTNKVIAAYNEIMRIQL